MQRHGHKISDIQVFLENSKIIKSSVGLSLAQFSYLFHNAV